jgi:muramoyltetrapeptide carboxypeptidase LdcA involved in peptidoglycan recycling
VVFLGISGVIVKPERLRPGDVVAVVSPSWGGPARFPATYEAGLDTLRSLGLVVREYPSARALNASVDERVRDIHAAFADKGIRAIIASVGGDDSVRLLPKLDSRLLARNPKIVLGYSDTCTLLLYLRSLGHVAFHGPSVMGGLAQAASYPGAFLAQFRSILFDATDTFEYQPFGVACDGYEEWSNPQNATRTKPLASDQGPRAVQGQGLRRGILWGGCLEVLEMVKGTPWWPRSEAWSDVVLFIEGSEEVPPPELYSRVLRSWGAAGNLDRVAALLVGRARGYDDSRKQALDDALRIAIGVEATRPDMPVISNCDFGHTDPQWLLPMGCRVEVDAERCRITLAESAVL